MPSRRDSCASYCLHLARQHFMTAQRARLVHAPARQLSFECLTQGIEAG